jgi:hypothetical protein
MPSIDRMIAEIEAYLATPMKDAESFWEHKARCFLHGLLEQLKQAEAEEQPVPGGDASGSTGANP